MSEHKEYNVKISVRNNMLLRLMRDAGINSASELARRAGTYPSLIGKIINLQVSAYDLRGEPKSVTKKLCALFKVLPEHLFPVEQLHNSLEKNTSELELDSEQMHSLSNNIEGNELLDSSIKKDFQIEYQTIDNALGKIRNREREVIEKTFGLNGCDQMTLTECGKLMNLSGARVRAIQINALRRLRSPSINTGLSDILDSGALETLQ